MSEFAENKFKDLVRDAYEEGAKEVFGKGYSSWGKSKAKEELEKIIKDVPESFQAAILTAELDRLKAENEAVKTENSSLKAENEKFKKKRHSLAIGICRPLEAKIKKLSSKSALEAELFIDQLLKIHGPEPKRKHCMECLYSDNVFNEGARNWESYCVLNNRYVPCFGHPCSKWKYTKYCSVSKTYNEKMQREEQEGE